MCDYNTLMQLCESKCEISSIGIFASADPIDNITIVRAETYWRI